MNEQINLTRIQNSIAEYPNLKRIFGEIKEVKTLYWFPYKQDKSEYEWNFFGILNSEDFSDGQIKEAENRLKETCGILERIDWSSYLNHISFKKRILSRLNLLIGELNKVYSDEQLKAGLLNNPFSFFSELEFAKFCLDSGYEIIEVEPSLSSGKKLDLKIKINNKSALVEVITPRLKLSMLQKQVGSFPISAEIENNIKSEFEHHEIEMNDITEDFILVIDGGYAGIDMINLQSAIDKFCKNQKTETKYLSGVFLKRGYTFNLINFKT